MKKIIDTIKDNKAAVSVLGIAIVALIARRMYVKTENKKKDIALAVEATVIK